MVLGPRLDLVDMLGVSRTTLLRAQALSIRMATKKILTKTSRCWPGYEPVPGKKEHEEGSCRKKPASRNGGKAVDREAARKAQIKRGGKRAVQAKKKAGSSS